MAIMNLFVDSNIFLQFYHFSEDDLKELRKLSQLIEKGDIKLFVTEQVLNEVKRNRDSKVSDAYKRFRDSKPEVKLPQICKSYPEHKEIKKAITALKRAISNLDAKLTNDINNRTLKADKSIDKLFKLAETIPCASYIKAATTRSHLGNPPGKDDSYGDAVNWEALLDTISDKDDLFFISDDKDYKSPIDDSRFNSFLADEWKSKKHSTLYFYTQLSEFFRNHHADIKLKDEEEKNQLIDQLARSGNFASTHLVIEKLSKFGGFSDSHIKQVIEIGLTNNQVYWIAEDADVNAFYRWIIEEKEDILDKDTYKKFKKAFLDKKPAQDAESDNGADDTS